MVLLIDNNLVFISALNKGHYDPDVFTDKVTRN